jgi:hypothetical protein
VISHAYTDIQNMHLGAVSKNAEFGCGFVPIDTQLISTLLHVVVARGGKDAGEDKEEKEEEIY